MGRTSPIDREREPKVDHQPDDRDDERDGEQQRPAPAAIVVKTCW